MIQIESDFSDYYDDELKGIEGNSILNRWKKRKVDKPTQYKILKSYGINTPIFGSPSEVRSQMKQRGDKTPNNRQVIVWLKNSISPLRITLAEALESHPDEFVVEYIVENDRSNVGKSVRCLYVGSKVFAHEVKNRLEHNSTEDEQWMAGKTVNGGILYADVSPVEEMDQVNEESRLLMNEINTMIPIYTSDIVERDGELYAVNFNPAPKLIRTPFYKAIPAEIMAQRISESLKLSELITEEAFNERVC